MTIEEKLELFKKSTMEEVDNRNKEVQEEYRKTLEDMYASRIGQAKEKAEVQIKAQTDVLMRRHNRTLSREANNIKRDIGEKHHEAKEKLFKDIEAKLEEYTKTSEYEEKLIRLILNARKVAKSNPITIYIDPVDADKVRRLEKETDMPITISKIPFLGGIRAVISSKNILIDNSFASRLAEAKQTFSI